MTVLSKIELITLLHSEINPGLASHGGDVALATLMRVLLCLSLAVAVRVALALDLTLKEGVEKTLMEKIPELKGVKDVDRSYRY